MAIIGSGSDGQVAYWVDTEELAGSDDLFWDSANSYLGVQTNSPTCPLHVVTKGTAILSQSVNDCAVFQCNDAAGTDSYARIIAGTTGTAALFFGDSAGAGAGSIKYHNTNDYMELDAARVGCNTTSPGARFHAVDDSTGLSTGKFSKNVGSATVPVIEIVQDSTTGGQPCLALDQDDVSEGFIDFLGSDRGAVQTGSRLADISSAASARVELNGTVYVIPLFTDQ